MPRLTIIFLLAACAFALTHLLATAGSLYWYYWWFDIVMHFWGGLLLGLGVHSLCRFKNFPFTPNLYLLLSVITVVTFSWELFEWSTGLYNPINYTIDTVTDVVLAFVGGLLMHFSLLYLYNKRI